MLIYKIFRADEWAALRDTGTTRGAPVDLADGYIHLSTADQAVETAAKHFAGAEGLVLCALDSDALGDALTWEVSRGDALFPHLYRALDLGDVLWVKPLPLLNGVHVFPEDIAGHVDPERAQFDAFKALPRDEPIDMLNLVRLRTHAAYPEGHAQHRQALSGLDAYRNYGRDSGPVFARVGGSLVWRGRPECLLMGPVSECWDIAFIARYPSAAAFFEMVTDPVYKAAVVHRQAAVRTSRLIRNAPLDGGTGFA